MLSHVQLFMTPWTAACLAYCPSLSPRIHSTHAQFIYKWHRWFERYYQPPWPNWHLGITTSNHYRVYILFKSIHQGRPYQFSLVQSLSHVRLFATPWTAAHQASLSITNSWSPPKPMSIESVMPYNSLILWRPLLLLPSIFPSIRVFSNESALRIRWPKYWSFSFNISPSNE